MFDDVTKEWKRLKAELQKSKLLKNKPFRYLLLYPCTFLFALGVVGELFPSEAQKAEVNEIAAEAKAAVELVQAPAANGGEATTLIPYEILSREENKVLDKLNLVIEVPLVGDRLPTKEIKLIKGIKFFVVALAA